jgi:hypothetical protein
MKLRGLIAVAIVGATLTASADASADIHTEYQSGQHTCHNGHGTVTASPYTSCAFADQITISFWQGINDGNCSRYAYKCGGSVWSPATRLWYHVTCLPSARPVTCYTNGHDSWIKFYPSYR